MRVLSGRSAVLTNHEVYKVLLSREAGKKEHLTRAKPSEKQVFEYLADQKSLISDEKAVAEFLHAVKPFQLSRAEVLQLLNLKPTTVVELYLILGGRMEMDQLESLLQLVGEYLPKSA